MRKRRKQHKSILLARKKRTLRKQMRIKNVLDGLGAKLTVKEIHWKTGMTEKTYVRLCSRMLTRSHSYYYGENTKMTQTNDELMYELLQAKQKNEKIFTVPSTMLAGLNPQQDTRLSWSRTTTSGI
jgi:hypothetical protein